MLVQYGQCLQGIEVAHSYHMSSQFAGIWGLEKSRPLCGIVPAVKVHEEKLLRRAAKAVEAAQKVRRRHARRPTKQEKRAADIEAALERLRKAMTPIRSEIGRYAYVQVNDESEAVRDLVREASSALQAERRKLWKMSRV